MSLFEHTSRTSAPSPSQPQVRSYLHTDFPQLAALWREAGLFVELIDTQENLLAKSTYLPDSIIVAESEGKIVGSVVVVYDGWMPFIFRLAVAKEFRKHGLGVQLLEAAEQKLQGLGADISAILVDAEAMKLVAWYQRLGYQDIGKQYLCLTKALKQQEE